MNWTLREAAEACGVSTDTVKRRLPELREAGAAKDEAGTWRVEPVQLRAVGLTPGKPSPPDATPNAGTATSAVEQRLAEVEDRARRAEQRAAVAEARLEERAVTIEGLTLALRALEARTPPSVSDLVEDPAANPSPQTAPGAHQARRPSESPRPERWWQRARRGA